MTTTSSGLDQSAPEFSGIKTSPKLEASTAYDTDSSKQETAVDPVSVGFTHAPISPADSAYLRQRSLELAVEVRSDSHLKPDAIIELAGKFYDFISGKTL